MEEGDWKAEDRLVDFLGDREASRGKEVFQRFLVMGRHRIMYLGWYVVLQQVVCESIPFGMTHRIDVVNVIKVRVPAMLYDVITQVRVIQVGQLPFVLVYFIERFQLDGKESGLHFVESGVITDDLVVVFLI